MKYLLILLTILFIYNSNTQPYRPVYHTPKKVVFYDYSSVISDLQLKGKKSKYYKKLDYESMLYLDKSSFHLLKAIKPDFLEKPKRIDTTRIFSKVEKNKVKKYNIKIKDIRELFDSKNEWKKVIDDLSFQSNDVYLADNIYIKDNKIAIFTVDNNPTSITYRAILKNNKIRVEVLVVWNTFYQPAF